MERTVWLMVAVGLTLAGLTPVAVADDAAPTVAARFANPEGAETPDFRRHVVPLLGRLGCNGRACHGSFQGQGGFRLSLFGYDLDADLAAITAGERPRIDRTDTLQSLLLQKPTLKLAHEGGQRLREGEWPYHLLRRWIAGGGTGTANEDVRFERLEISPSEIVFQQPGDSLRLQVFACWSDGSREDVTPLCRFRSNDESIADIDETGLVKAARAGDTHVVAFYDNGVQPVSVLIPFCDQRDEGYPGAPTPTRIDELVVAKLRRLGVTPSELCTDAEFLRRVSLDLGGVLPSPREVEAFLADPGADKRTRKIDELLERPTYAAWWTTRLCDFLGNSPNQLNEQPFNGELASRQWYAWLYQRVAENVPYDQIASGMILASGRAAGETYDDYCREMGRQALDDSGQSFAARPTMPHFWMRRNNRKPEEKAMSFAYAFMGVRIQCAQCHKHPFDQWTKRDFDEFAAFFKPITFGVAPDARQRQKELQQALEALGVSKQDLRKKTPQLLAEGKLMVWREVFVEPVRGPKKGRPKDSAGEDSRAADAKLHARFLEGETVELEEGDDPRQALVEWLRRDADQYLARAFVNRVWAGYFHVGIVEPADDLNRANPPANQPLLDYLTRGFIERNFDMKWLHREIVNSRTYQLSCRVNQTNRHDSRNFSHAVPRRLPAEAAYNALLQATARTDQLDAFHHDMRQLTTGSSSAPPNAKGRGKANYALTIFGRPLRATNCDCERSMEPTLLQTLYLRNDGEMLSLIERPDGWLAELGGADQARQLAQQIANLQARAKSLADEQASVAAQVENLQSSPIAEAEEDPLPVIAEIRREDLPAETAQDTAAAAQQQRQRAKQRQQAQASRNQQIKQLEKRRQQLAKESAQTHKQLEKLSALVPAAPAPPLDRPMLIRQAYLRTVGRAPTDEEMARVSDYINTADQPRTAYRDILWALLNTKEFILNH